MWSYDPQGARNVRAWSRSARFGRWATRSRLARQSIRGIAGIRCAVQNSRQHPSDASLHFMQLGLAPPPFGPQIQEECFNSGQDVGRLIAVLKAVADGLIDLRLVDALHAL